MSTAPDPVRFNLEVRLTYRLGRKYYPTIENDNKSIKPGFVLVKGDETPLTGEMKGGRYYINWQEGSKTKRKSVGKDLTKAVNLMKKKEAELKEAAAAMIAVNKVGLTLVPTTPIAPKAAKGERIDAAVTRYLDQLRDKIRYEKRSALTLKEYKVMTRYFLEYTITIPRTYITEITAQDMLNFGKYLFDKQDKKGERQLCDRSISNRFTEVMSFLKWAGHVVIIPTGERPDYDEKEVEIFEGEALADFFERCTRWESLLFRFFLQSGLRESEVANLNKACLKKSTCTVRVEAKSAWVASNGKQIKTWKPKHGRNRSVPITAALMDELLALMADKPANALVFPAEGGIPNLYMLNLAKEIAARPIILNCGKLDPKDFWLHKFRATFATTVIRSRKTDLITLCDWMGHVDYKSINRYVKAAGGWDAQGKAEAIWGGGDDLSRRELDLLRRERDIVELEKLYAQKSL